MGNGLNGNLGVDVILDVAKAQGREYKDVQIQNPTMVANLARAGPRMIIDSRLNMTKKNALLKTNMDSLFTAQVYISFLFVLCV